MHGLDGKISGFVSDLKIYLQPTAVRMFFLGFSAGLPLLLVLGTLGFWLREAGIDLKTIGFMSWVGLVYGCKWLWAPLVDNLPIPFLTKLMGQRRSWLLVSQLSILVSLAFMAFCDPLKELTTLTVLALIAAFSSATQDIALDAYRIESAETRYQGILAANYQAGYRLAMIWAGAGAFALAAIFQDSNTSEYDQTGWTAAYLIMSLSMLVGVFATLLSPTPNAKAEGQKIELLSEKEKLISESSAPSAKKFAAWFKAVCLTPFIDFFDRYKYKAIIILLLIATYRISDVVMAVMSNPFYRDMGFSKEEVAAISKVFGVLMTLAGTFLGGLVVLKFGVLKTLFLGGILSAITNLLFSALSTIGHSVTFLVFTISADNLASGLASAAFIAYLSGLTNVKYSATQYATLSSLMLILPKFLAGFSGVAVESVGYGSFFAFTATLGIPALILIAILGYLQKKDA